MIDDNRAIHEDFKKILCPRSTAPNEMARVEGELFEKPPAVFQQAFEIDSAFQGREGLEMVNKSLQQNRRYSLIFLDMRMPPGWDGLETAKQIWQADPDLQMVICSAYSDYSWDEMTARLGVSDRLVILKKPFDPIEVIQLAHALAEKWCLRRTAQLKMEELEAIVTERTSALQNANKQLKLEMEERARTQETLRQAQKMEALGQLAGGVAHDFNNLLTVIRGYADCLLAEPPRSDETHRAIEEIRHAADRAAQLTSQMLMFSRKKPLELQDLDLANIIGKSGRLLKRLLGENIRIEIQPNLVPLPIHADPVMMEQILLNLAVNARDAMLDGGRLEICADELEIAAAECRGTADRRPGRFVRLRVSDSGTGIAPEVLPRLFEPFFTTKEPGKGTGMGLATVYGIVRQHNGWVEVQSQPGCGATFIIFLPARLSASRPAGACASNGKIAGGRESILFVEDEESVRQMTAEILQGHGYRVYAAATSSEALAVWDVRGREIDLLLTDMVLRGDMPGHRLAKRLRLGNQRLKVAFTTGYSVDSLKLDFPLQPNVNLLHKPYSLDELLRTVRRCLDEPLPV